MLEQLIINNDFETVMLVAVITILTLMAAIAIGFGLSALFLDKDIFLGIMAFVVALIGISGIVVSVQPLNEQVNEIKTIKKGHIDDYYNLTKDGKAIKFTLKDDKSELLQKQVEAEIIDEDSKTYQIQYKDTIDRVPKTEVK